MSKILFSLLNLLDEAGDELVLGELARTVRGEAMPHFGDVHCRESRFIVMAGLFVVAGAPAHGILHSPEPQD